MSILNMVISLVGPRANVENTGVTKLSTHFHKLEFRESDVSPGKTEVTQGKSVEFIT